VLIANRAEAVDRRPSEKHVFAACLTPHLYSSLQLNGYQHGDHCCISIILSADPSTKNDRPTPVCDTTLRHSIISRLCNSLIYSWCLLNPQSAKRKHRITLQN